MHLHFEQRALACRQGTGRTNSRTTATTRTSKTREEGQKDERDKGTKGTKGTKGRASFPSCGAAAPFSIFLCGVKRPALSRGAGAAQAPAKAQRRHRGARSAISRCWRTRAHILLRDERPLQDLRSLRKIHWQCRGEAAHRLRSFVIFCHFFTPKLPK